MKKGISEAGIGRIAKAYKIGEDKDNKPDFLKKKDEKDDEKDDEKEDKDDKTAQ